MNAWSQTDWRCFVSPRILLYQDGNSAVGGYRARVALLTPLHTIYYTTKPGSSSHQEIYFEISTFYFSFPYKQNGARLLMCKLLHELANDLRFTILGNEKVLRKSQN